VVRDVGVNGGNVVGKYLVLLFVTLFKWIQNIPPLTLLRNVWLIRRSKVYLIRAI